MGAPRSEWGDRPDVAAMRNGFTDLAALARQGAFRAPESGWTAEQVLAHVLAATELFVEVGEGVRRGAAPECADPHVVADEVLARRARELGGLPGLARELEAAGARLAAQAESLTDAEAATEVRFRVWHDGREIADEMRAFGTILAGHASFHLPLHRNQLAALAEPA